MAPDAMLVVDQSSRIMQANALAERLFGYPQGTLAGQSLDVLIPARSRDPHHQHVTEYLRDPRPRPMGAGLRLWGLRRDGSEFAVEISLNPLPTPAGLHILAAIRDVSEYRRIQQALEQATAFDDQGKVTGFQSVGVDITERMRAEEASRASEEWYRQLFELGSDALFLIENETGRILEVNAAAEELYGYRREELLQMKNTDLSAESSATRAATLEGQQRVLIRFHRKQDGSVFPVDITARHFQWQRGGVHLAAIRDITERLRAQQEIEKQRSFLRTVIDADPHFIYVENRHGQIMLSNQSLARRFGLTPEQMVGHTFADFVADPEFVRTLIDDDKAILTQTQDRIEREARFVDQAGQVRWAYTVKAPITNEAGEIEQLIGVSIDITERKRAEEALFEAKERAQVTLHSIGDAVITTDGHASVDYLNPVAEALTGWTMAEAQGRPLCEVFRIVNEQTRQPAPDPVARCLQEGKIVGLANHSVLFGRHGQEYDIDDTAAPIRGRDGQVLGAVLVFHDVSENRRLVRQLAHDATHDALTGLINRPEFERRLERALASAQQYGVQHALCYLDLDQFKIVNDTAGHTAGDELLKQINTLLSGMFRERDTLARIGGDEFGLLLENCPLDRAQVIAQTVVSTLREHRFHWEDRSYQIGVSIGLVPITAATQDTTQLLTQADVACYTAKELGRNRVHLYQTEDTETTQRHGDILGAAGLRDALEQGRFRLHYQPIVPLHAPDPRPVRYEVLLRVAYQRGPDETSELVLPAAFIPAAERYGLMNAIDRWVIQTAFRDYAGGIGQTGARIAINLSGNSLSDETLLAFIEAQFAAHAFPPERVCFEITETAAIQNLRRALELLAALKRRGSQLALDDFGSGLSSFHYLKTLPVDYLKIDGSFVKDMLDNPSDSALVAAINQMSHTLGIQTIAEYTHSQAIVERLRELGVDYAQGYFFGQPAPWGKQS